MGNGFKAIFRQESALLPILIYANVKLVLPTKQNAFPLRNIVVHAFRILLTTLLLPIASLIVIAFACNLELVTLVARLYFGQAYHDNLVGTDALFNLKTSTSKNTIQVIQLLKPVSSTPEKMLHMFRDRNRLDAVFKNHPRLSCVRKTFLGYSFFVKINVDYSKIARFIEDYETWEDFQKLTYRATESDLPYDDEYMWEILVGRHLVEVKPGRFYYPLLFRFHHSLTDGIGLYSFLLNSFVKNGYEQFQSECAKYNQIFAKTRQPKPNFTFKNCLMKLRSFINTDIHCNYDVLFSKETPNVLYKDLTGEKIIACSFEEPGEKLLAKIKEIKNALQVSYADVVLSALSTSLSEHYKKHDVNPPKEITSLNPIFRYPGKLEDMLRIKENGESETIFSNNFTIGMIDLPVDVNLLDEPLANRVVNVNKSSEKLKNSIDIVFNSWLLNVFMTTAPKRIAQLAANFMHSTLIITNVPGMEYISYENDCFVEDMYFWGNHFQKTGVMISLFSFERRLRLTVHVDRGLIKNVEEVQQLGDGVFRCIKRLHSQVCQDMEDTV